MKIKHVEGKPLVAWSKLRTIVADFTDSDTVEVNKEDGEYLVKCGYKEVKRRKKAE